ncbi:MAG: molybdopterin-synthase adenylyltransferase MoeB [Thiohalophilus sp.]|uniref:HesA/MoeB/ThiF family protein n=1 Tax=Thiohalophilus sp. TaxID=3028392 RepID=UPI002870501C|nr:molybdopterin-synthase adenylyltransferase MoeB [Thiohalophilus sp.]MDR9436275.1 molybdopterin-synthase adenylyltransferase MoeB [Thiohalophilus sp.]
MNDEQLLRYSRQIMLPQVDVAGQEKLLASRVLIIGLGGLGSPIALYLAAAGVGQLVLVDHDHVDLSNLQRQILHRYEDIGRPKIASAAETLMQLNPQLQITTLDHKLSEQELLETARNVDVVVDATDNFEIRFALNRVCVETGTPLVSGAAIRMEGQVSVFLNKPGSPCYRCLYRDEGELDASCSENGVLAPVVGIIGSVQATEVLKILLNIGSTLDGKLLLLDALHMEWRTLTLKQDSECPVCGATA